MSSKEKSSKSSSKREKSSKKDKKSRDATSSRTLGITTNGDASNNKSSAATNDTKLDTSASNLGGGGKTTEDDRGMNMGGDLNNDDDGQPQLTPAELYYAAVPLAMPSHATFVSDPSVDKNLKPIRDDGSAFAQVARSCLNITQFVGASAGQDDAHAVASSHLFHDKTYAKVVVDCFSALITCTKEHKDRRCRILACQTLALGGRTAYAHIRHSPVLFALRESPVNLVEDEVGSEVPTALLNVALDDGDDGVSATAVECLGTLTLATSNAHAATIVDDELLQEIQSMAFARTAPYAPSLRSVLLHCPTTLEEDPSVAQLELQSRIFPNIMAPRLLQLVTRIVHYNASHHHRMTLPFVTACLIHQLRTNAASTYDVNRSTFAKRWVDLDCMGLVNDVVTALLLPSMQGCLDGDLAHTAALCGLRLANACPTASWVLEICRWAIVVLREENSSTGMLESKVGTLATLLIALRALPLPERAPLLESMINEVASLPFTIMVPHGVSSPGLLLQMSKSKSDNAQTNLEADSSETFACYRKPARIAFFTELALSIFMDGPLGVTVDVDGSKKEPNPNNHPTVQRSYYLKRFLSSASVVNICKEQDNPVIVRMRDEILLVFTTVAWEVGRRFRVSPDGSVIQPPQNNSSQAITSLEVEEWTRLAFTTLSIFSPCARWGRRPEYLEEDLGLLTAGQSSYIRLLQEFLHFVGLLNPMSSVTFKLTPNACPPHLLWDQMIESASFLTHWDATTVSPQNDADNSLRDRSFMGSLNDVMAQDVAALVDDFIEKDLRQGIISHHMRMFVLTLGVDQWVQSRYVAIRRNLEAANNRRNADRAPPLTLNLASARDLLVAVSPKRLLTKLLEFHTVPVDANGKKKKDPIKKLALETVRVCVACVENIAMTAVDWRRRCGPNQESQAIVQMAVASLEGKLDDEPMDESLRPIMGPLCDAATSRIQAFYQSKSHNSDGIPSSELVMQPMKYKIKPLVSSSTIKGAERDGAATHEYMHGYLMQLSRQIISARVDATIYSAPVADAFFSCKARPRNWLRLATPPLPDNRDARGLRFRTNGPGREKNSAWGRNVTSITSGSDPVAAYLGHSISRTPRYDNEDEYRIRVFLQVWNTTAVEITEGLQMGLGVAYQQHEVGTDSASLEFVSSLGSPEAFQLETAPVVSTSSAYKHPFSAEDSLVWEIALHYVSSGKVVLHPTIVFRNVREEKHIGEFVGGSGGTKMKRRNSTSSVASQKGEDDFQVSTKEKGSGFDDDQVEYENVSLSAEAVELSPLLGLQPCPLVFFRDSWGDLDTFRFLWFRMPSAVPPIKLDPKVSAFDTGFTMSGQEDEETGDLMGRTVGESSSLLFEGEAIPGGFATKLWAFMSLAGDRVMCVMTETENNTICLHLKADSKQLLFTLVGAATSRQAVVSALVPGMSANY
ncbi:expressed unknown protein [Seminavis robusta]|uniref:Uncharacterized protein n=1 Tax=Seminavis robusta TaxID=568900 RepID=A0A9N8ELJ1_9STRA|nr:expressed unknown protein [Seminavis robusta]|eukprot:Sro1179_g249650.1 n/a (1420) ;mRNA; f:26594-30853